MSIPHVVADAPPAWIAADVAQPPLASGSGARFTQWDAQESPAHDARLVRACVSTPIPGWVADMRTAVEARGDALAMATAERMSGAPAERREVGGRSVVRAMGAPESDPPIGVVRTFLGFDDHEVATCFAVCIAKSAMAKGAGATCESSVGTAQLEGGTAPPSPGLLVGAASWAVHHPLRTAGGSALAACVLGVLAVVVRRRPRSRI
jgi:hypothetical protein